MIESLGYKKFTAAGGDLGSGVTKFLARVDVKYNPERNHLHLSMSFLEVDRYYLPIAIVKCPDF